MRTKEAGNHNERKILAFGVRREKKEDVLRFRVASKQRSFWDQSRKDLGVTDFSSYARFAIDRAFLQDLRSKDPKWQEFIKAINPIAKEKLGFELSDNFLAKTGDLTEFYKALWQE